MIASCVDRQLLPADRVVLPLLEEQHRAPRRATGRDDRDRGRLDEGRVLRAVDEPGEVEVPVVRPADDLVGERRLDASAIRSPRVRSKMTSYAAPVSQITTSCWVAGMS